MTRFHDFASVYERLLTVGSWSLEDLYQFSFWVALIEAVIIVIGIVVFIRARSAWGLSAASHLGEYVAKQTELAGLYEKALTGSLDRFSVNDVIQFLNSIRETGILDIVEKPTMTILMEQIQALDESAAIETDAPTLRDRLVAGIARGRPFHRHASRKAQGPRLIDCYRGPQDLRVRHAHGQDSIRQRLDQLKRTSLYQGYDLLVNRLVVNRVLDGIGRGRL